MMIGRVFMLAMVCLLLVANSTPVGAGVTPPQPNGFWLTSKAYKVDIAYWVGLEPHYGAFYSGYYGRDQHYLGLGGDVATCASSASCISGWSWWGTNLNVLLLPKSNWLLTELPGGPKWNGLNYRATQYIS